MLLKIFRKAFLPFLIFLSSACAPDASTDYHVYLASGYPTATAIGLVTKWTKDGSLEKIIADYTLSPGYNPEGLLSDTSSGDEKLLVLSLATTGRVDSFNTDGSNWSLFFDNASALIAGSHRFVSTTDGGYLVSRTAGVERFTSARTRVGAAARYGTTGTCTAAAITSATVATVSGTEYVVSSNAAATPSNKLNLYNGGTAACIVGLQPVGPATTMWPVDVEYVQSEAKLFVLYYPFTAATTNAQIWAFDVTGTTINNGTLVYNDTSADIAVISATPQNLSSAITFYDNGAGKFFLVATSNNSVLKLNWNGSTLTKSSALPFLWGSAYLRSISDIIVMDK